MNDHLQPTRFEIENRFGGQAAPTPWRYHDYASPKFLRNQDARQFASDPYRARNSMTDPVRWSVILWTAAAMLPGAIALGVLILWLAGVVRF